jgi:hypothetical protein
MLILKLPEMKRSMDITVTDILVICMYDLAP